MKSDERAMSYIGIAKKSGKLAIGTPAVCEALRRGEGNAVFAAGNISGGTMNKLEDKCSFYGAGLYVLAADAGELAHQVGKTGAVAAVLIRDAGLERAAVKSVTGKDGDCIE